MSKEFAELLKQNRNKVKLTQEELADKCKIERTYMSKLESEKSNPSFSTIKKLCDGLGMTTAEFFENIKERKEPAIVFLKTKEIRQAKEKHRIRAEMIPIKVMKDISAFSLGRDIKSEFAPKYTYVEKSAIFGDLFEEIEDIDMKDEDVKNIIGLELDRRIDLINFQFKKNSILLIDVEPSPINLQLSPGLCILDTGDGKGPSLQRFARLKEYIAFFDPKKDPLWHEANYLFRHEDFSEDFFRGVVIGAIGAL